MLIWGLHACMCPCVIMFASILPVFLFVHVFFPFPHNQLEGGINALVYVYLSNKIIFHM